MHLRSLMFTATALAGLVSHTHRAHAFMMPQQQFHPQIQQPVYRPPVQTFHPAPVFRPQMQPQFHPQMVRPQMIRPQAGMRGPMVRPQFGGRPIRGVPMQTPRHFVPGPRIVAGHDHFGHPIYHRGRGHFVGGLAVGGFAGLAQFNGGTGTLIISNNSSQGVVAASAGNWSSGVSIAPGETQVVVPLTPSGCDAYTLHADGDQGGSWDGAYYPCSASAIGFNWNLTD